MPLNGPITRFFAAILAGAICVAAAADARGASQILEAPAEDRTVDDVLQFYGPGAMRRLKPYFERAGLAFPPADLVFLAMKRERLLEVWARNGGPFRLLKTYRIRKASGRGGPKLREGDRQVPEGVYRVVDLNPNSRYHLSLKLDYPNAFDLRQARREGRTEPGSNIFIHGKAESAGCLAMGDTAIEELFLLAAALPETPIQVVIAPHDPRRRPLDAGDPRLPAWTGDLYRSITRAFARHPRRPR